MMIKKSSWHYRFILHCEATEEDIPFNRYHYYCMLLKYFSLFFLFFVVGIMAIFSVLSLELILETHNLFLVIVAMALTVYIILDYLVLRGKFIWQRSLKGSSLIEFIDG